MNRVNPHRATVVTAITDLSQVGAIPRRSINEYLRLGDDVLSLQLPLVVFCDDNLKEHIENRRRELAPDFPTVTQSMKVRSQSDAEWKRVDDLLSEKRTASLGNPRKDTTDYVFIGWSKWHWIHQAAQILEADGYWWIDFGLTHVARRAHHLESALSHAWPSASNHNTILLSLEKDDSFVSPNYFAHYVSTIATNTFDWLTNGAPTVAGGIFAVHRRHVDDWRDKMENLLAQALERDTVVSEQMLLSWHGAQNEDTTRVIASQYVSLLEDVVNDIPVSLSQQSEKKSTINLSNFIGDGWSPMNPSIAVKSDGSYLAVVRHVNYSYDNDKYTPLDNTNIIKTRNVLVRLDRDLSIISAEEIDDSLCCGQHLFPVYGLEDARIFSVNSDWFVSATLREHRSDGLCEIIVARLDNRTVTSSSILPSPLTNRHEKNWMPLHEHNRCEWMWNISPPIRITLDDVTSSFVVTPSVSSLTPTPLRGGSQLIKWDNGWLCVVHDVRWNKTTAGSRREYRHYFARLSEDLTTTTISRPFIFEHSGIEFCAGMAPTPNGAVLSYGIEDREARLIELSVADIDALFD